LTISEETAASSDGLSTFIDAMESYEALGNKLTEIRLQESCKNRQSWVYI